MAALQRAAPVLFGKGGVAADDGRSPTSEGIALAVQRVRLDRCSRMVAQAPEQAEEAKPLMLAQAIMPLPLVPGVPVAGDSPDDRATTKVEGQIEAAIARAGRRIGDLADEVREGKLGTSAGAVLLGRPFPDWVDRPRASLLHTEAEPDKPSESSRSGANGSADQAKRRQSADVDNAAAEASTFFRQPPQRCIEWRSPDRGRRRLEGPAGCRSKYRQGICPSSRGVGSARGTEERYSRFEKEDRAQR